MEYTIKVPAYTIKSLTIYTCNYASFPKYPILTIDKESYIEGAIIENSDEGWLPLGSLVHNLQIGRYSSLAKKIHFLIGRGKDYLRVSTSAAKIFQQPEINSNRHHEKGSIIIENDVWIGQGASVMSGVTVHNGAIIAAKSHVVKDVPPYAIVGGNPAKVIGYRFSDDIIQKLLTIQWWYWPDEKVEQNAQFFTNDISLFCERFYADALDKKLQIPDQPKTQTFTLVDYEDNYPVTPEVIDIFVKKYSFHADKELILYWIDDNTEMYLSDLYVLRGTVEKIRNHPHILCSVELIEGSLQDALNMMPSINSLIINRRPETIQIMSCAQMYHEDIEIISGVDVPITI